MAFKTVLAGICCFTIIYFTGCGNDDTIINPGGGGNTGTTLSGTISGYPGGSIIARAVLFKYSPVIDSFYAGTDTVDNNGELNLSLTTPPSDYLSALGVDTSLNISDTSAKITGFASLKAYNFSNISLALITKKNFADTNVVEGSFVIQYIFSSKAVTITGYDTNISMSDTSIYGYNLNFAAGWNVVTVKQVYKRPAFQQVEFTSGETAGATWRYEISMVPVRKYKLGIVGN